MTELPAKLVVRRATSRHLLVLASIAALAGVAAVLVVYQLGRYAGGYDMLAAARQRSELTVTAARLQKTNDALRKQIAELDTMGVGRAQERAELARTIGELQSQVAGQAQQLAFYRGVVSHSDPRGDLGAGLEIQQLHISATAPPGRFEVDLMILQTARPQAVVQGTYQLSVAGRQQGKPATLGFVALTGGGPPGAPFSFRYFKSLQVDIAIPAGFSPERLTVEVKAGGKRPANPLIQTFPWKVDAS
ncbi:MAG: DUF6776 family protein [Steroidobacteraceae bacterium]